MKIYPDSIIKNSVEHYFYSTNIKTVIIYQIVLFLVLISIILSMIIKIDVTVQSRGYVVSRNLNNSLTSVVCSEVIKNVLFENKKIIKGDTLIWLNTDKIDNEIFLSQSKSNLYKIYIRDLKRIIKGNYGKIKSLKYINEFRKYKQEYKASDTKIRYLKNKLNIDKKLFNNKALSKFNFDKSINDYKIDSINLGILKKKYFNKWQNDLNKFELLESEVLLKINQLKISRRDYFIIAPSSGRIIKLREYSPKSYLYPNNVVAEISSLDSLIVDCYVPPNSIGYLRTGMYVKYQFDSYNYNQWGFGTGIIDEICSDALIINNNVCFKVKCKLNEKYLKLKNNFKGHIVKGMTATVRFNITKRTIFQLIYDKLDNWFNPKNNI